MDVYLKTGTLQVTKLFRTHFFSLTGSRWEDVKSLCSDSKCKFSWQDTFVFSLIYVKFDLPQACCATENHFFKPAPPQIHDNAEDAANTSSQLHESTHAH